MPVKLYNPIMVGLKDIHPIHEFEWEIPLNYQPGMQVPVRLFADRHLLKAALDDKSIDQAINASMLPGLAGPVMVMPDVHQGYGFPIGGVAAFKYPDGIISPGAIGYDINCGVRLLGSQIKYDEVRGLLPELASAVNQFCPSGVGVKSAIRLNQKDLREICRFGSRWAYKKGYATEMDMMRTEENGIVEGADPEKVSLRAIERGMTQLGSLGSGNHFIEIDRVDEIYDAQAAAAMGLLEGYLAVQIHCGSRGFGHQICTDYVQSMQGVVKKYGIHLPDRELVCAPIESPEGKDYLAAMRSAANYAFANRQLLTHFAREAFEAVLAGKVQNWHLHQIYDITHNMGKVESHQIQGKQVRVCVHRKGATRAFGPGSPGLPPEYQKIGQPVLVPGSMGTASWVLTGTQMSMERAYGSACHGAGRVMSRSQAKKEVRGDTLRDELEKQGIQVRAGSLAGLAEEAPQAYKDVDDVIRVVTSAGIARKVARLRPVAVIKG